MPGKYKRCTRKPKHISTSNINRQHVINTNTASKPHGTLYMNKTKPVTRNILVDKFSDPFFKLFKIWNT